MRIPAIVCALVAVVFAVTFILVATGYFPPGREDAWLLPAAVACLALSWLLYLLPVIVPRSTP